MATYLQGQTDKLGPMQLYKPDYSFLTQVYGTRQAEYDRGFNMVKSLYNSVLNNQLSSEDNELYRQEVFKKIQNSLKSISATDLSNPTNVMRAQSMIDPISKDQDLIYDMSFTAHNNAEKQKLATVRNSTDPKVRSTYNKWSEQAIGLAEQDMRNAKRGDGSITKIQPGTFIPYEDEVEYLNKAAQDQKINIKVSKSDGRGYIITTTNGEMAGPAFYQWAKTQMGEKFDRQIQQRGYVEAENNVRSVMNSAGVNRADALNIVSKELSQRLIDQAVAEGGIAQEQLNDAKNMVDQYKTQYPNGVPKSKIEEYKKAKNIVDQYDTMVKESQDQFDKLKTMGPEYVAQNLHMLYSNEVKRSIARSWAGTYAGTHIEYEEKPDQVLLTKWNIASRERTAAANRANAMAIANKKIAAAQGMAEDKKKWELQKMKMKGEIPFEEVVGTNQGINENLTGVDILNDDYKETNESLFLKTFGAGNGLVNVLIPKGDHGKVFSLMSKVNEVANGQQQNFTDDEVALLTQLGSKFGTQVFRPTSPVNARATLNNMIGAIYSKSGPAVRNLMSMGKSQEAAKMAPVFNQVLGQMASLIESREQQNAEYKRVAAIALNADGSAKPGFEGITIKGYAADGTPIVDYSGLNVEKRKYISDNAISATYNTRTRPYGDVISIHKLQPAELFNIANANAVSTAKYADGSEFDMKILEGLSPDALAKLFGDNAYVKYDPANKTVQVGLRIDPSSSVATKLKKDKQNSEVQLTIPYETIEANPQVFGRINQYLGKNKITNQNFGNLDGLITQPYGTVSSPGYMENFGVKYSISGIKDASSGAYGLSIDLKYYNPTTNKWETQTRVLPATPGDPKSLAQAQQLKNQMVEGYMQQRVANDKSYEDEEVVDYDVLDADDDSED